MVLVGKDGHVLSIDVRGQRLNQALAEQFGPVIAGNTTKRAGAREGAKK